MGVFADLDPGADPATSAVSNATALGYRAYVSQSNKPGAGQHQRGKRGHFRRECRHRHHGAVGAAADAKVGIGTTAPQEALHVVRSDGTAMIKVEETSTTTANRVQFRLANNGGPWFKLLNSNTSQEWTFAMDQFDNFIFSLIGTGGSEFKIYKTGQVVMGPGGTSAFDLQPNGDLAIAGNLTAAGITYVSDRNRKENFTSVNGQEILEKLVELEITRWNFKEDPQNTAHLGPMAQDFYAAFGLGGDDRSISASDISGVALAAIQGLNRKLAEEDAELAEQAERLIAQNAKIQELKARLDRFEALEGQLLRLTRNLTTKGVPPARDAD